MIILLRYMTVITAALVMSCSHNPSLHITEQLYFGTITGYAFDEHRLYLSEGDTLEVILSEPKLDVIIFTPINIVLSNDEPLQISTTDEYILRVLMPRALARAGYELNYNLKVQIVSE